MGCNCVRTLIVSLAAFLAAPLHAQVLTSDEVGKSDAVRHAAEQGGAIDGAGMAFTGTLGDLPVRGLQALGEDDRPTLTVPEFTQVELDGFAVTSAEASKKRVEAGLPASMLKVQGGQKGAGRKATADDFAAQALVMEQAASASAVTAAAVPPLEQTADPILNQAHALKYDVDLIYEFVRGEIDIYPTYGVQKGAAGALLERQGSPHDVAELMHQLLLASGYQSDVVLGVVDLTPLQVRQFYQLPTDNTCAIQQVFVQAQVPFQVGYDPAAPDCNTPLQLLRIQHPWVQVVIDGVTYQFDPAHKNHGSTAGIDVLSVMQHDRVALRAAALEGATVTSQDYGVQSLNRDAVRDNMQDYALRLTDHIRQWGTHSLDSVIGGNSIARYEPCLPEIAPSCRTRQTRLPYQATGYTTTAYSDGFPGDQRVIVRVTFPGVDWAFTSDFLYDKRVSIESNELLQPQLTVGGEVIATGNAVAEGQIAPLAVEVFHAAYGQRFADARYTEGILSGETLNLGFAFGPDTGARTTLFRESFVDAVESEGEDRYSTGVLGAQFASLAGDLFSQISATNRIIDAAADTESYLHHIVGFTGHRNAAFHNLRMTYNTANRTGNADLGAAAYILAVTHASALEGSTIEQLTDLPAVSSVRMLDLAMERDVPLFLVTRDNLDTLIAPQLVNCQNGIPGIRDIVNTGQAVFLPGDCTQALSRFRGIGFITLGGGVGTYISGFYNGGYGADLYDQGWGLDAINRALRRTRKTKNPKEALDPVDLSSGHFTYSQTDLLTGDGEFPSALGISRMYSSGLAAQDGALGRGWTHNLDVKLTEKVDALQILGQDSALDAVTSIAEIFAMVDMLAPGTLDVVDLGIYMAGHQWYAERLGAKAVSYQSALATTDFVPLPDGTYNPGPESNLKLERVEGQGFRVSTPDRLVSEFDTDGKALSWATPAGAAMRFAYDAGGRLANVSNSFGRTLDFTYVGTRIESVTDENGRSVSYRYDVDGNLVGATDAMGEETLFTYVEPGRMDAYYMPANPAHPQVLNTYDGLGRLASQIDADGFEARLYVAGHRSELVSGMGRRSIDYFGDRGELLWSIEDVDPDTALEEWVPKFRQYFYDARGRLGTIRSNFEPQRSFAYDDTACTGADKTCTDNIAWQDRTATRLGGTSTPALPNQRIAYRYEPVFNRVATITDAYGGETDYTYDPATGVILSETSPAPSEGAARPRVEYSYQSFPGAAGFGPVTLPVEMRETIGDGVTRTTRYSYDPANHLVPLESRVTVGGREEVNRYTYDAAGNLTSIDGPRQDVADVWTMRFDAERRMVESVDPLGRATRFAYDADGEMVRSVSQADAGWLATCRTVAPSGKVIGETGPALVAAETSCPPATDEVRSLAMSYDGEGNLASVSEQRTAEQGGVRTHGFSYAPSGDLVGLRSAIGSPLEQLTGGTKRSFGVSLDPAVDSKNRFDFAMPGGFGSRWLETDGHGRTSSFGVLQCTDAGRVPYCTVFKEASINYDYDIADNPTQITLRDGDLLQYTYDALGRTSSLNAPESFNDATYTYDDLGRLLLADGGGKGVSVAYSYDELGRVLSETTPLGTVSYTYDEAGNRTRITWPDGFFVSYAYDALDRMTEVRANGSVLVASFSYDALSRRTARTYGNGTITSYGYDGSSRLETLSIDLAGSGDDATFTYAYDQAGSLTSAASSNDAYDFNGFYDLERPHTTDGYDAYLSAGAAEFVYDDNGNLISDGTWSFSYDTFNRLTKAVIKGGPQANYAYDAVGRLFSRHPKSTKETVRYLYAGDQLIGEYANGDILIRRYVPGPVLDEVVAIEEGAGAANRSYVYHDRLGSTVAVADTAGTATAKYSYGPFGEPGATEGMPLRYNGKPLDPDTGLYYSRARWYSPYLGRFMSRDPIGIDDGLNTYAYVGNDPLNYTDPSGECGVAGALGGGLIEGLGQLANRKDRAAWGDAWGELRNGNFGNAFDAAQSQLGRVGEEAVMGAVTCGLGRLAAKAGGRLARGGGRCCFVEGTLVDTENGLRPIEDIAIGEKVWSRDEKTGETALKPVVDLIHLNQRQIWEVAFTGMDGETASFQTTDDHPWWVAGQGWKKTEELVAGMAVTTRDGRGMVLASVVETDRIDATYNLTVADFETYFVGEQRVLVHNCPAYGGGNRRQAYGDPSRSTAARNARRDAEGKPCPSCGKTMDSSNSRRAPNAQHDPALSDHYNEYGGKYMTDAQRREYARSQGAISGAHCKSCQSAEGARQRNKYRNQGQ